MATITHASVQRLCWVKECTDQWQLSSRRESGALDPGSSAPSKAGPHRQQRYRKEWEADSALKPWLQDVSNDPLKAKCRVCIVVIVVELTALAKKLQERKFSVMCDESTDIGSVKTSCVVVRFFYVDSLSVESKFWELYDVCNADDPESVERGATGKSLYEGMMKTFKDHNVPIKNMIGFGADGCSVMMGVNNSVSSHFRSDCPGLVVMKCICHSAHLCASQACRSLPRRCEDLAREVYNFFKCSSKRQSEYKQFQSFCDLKPHKVLHPSQTRWLSLVAVVQRLLEQWEALKLFFSEKWLTEKLLAIELIINSLHDPFMKLYFMFLDWVLPNFTEFNKFFQSDKAVITVLHDKVSMLFRDLLLSFMDRTYVMKTDLNTVNPERRDRHLSDSQMYLGVKVMQGLNNPSIQEKKAQQQEFFQRCRSFLVVACTEIKKRYNFNDGVLSKLNCLCPKNALSSEFRERIPSLFPLASELPLIVPPDDHSLLQKLDDQWRMFPILQHELKNLVNESPDKFWGEVSQKESSFSDLANFALTALCLPHSNAECERVFSKVNLFKTKQRNRLKTRTANGALLSASCIKGSCVHFTPANDMFSRINNHAQLFQNIREHEFDLEEDS
ncbi:uncharacterized protein [Macrobrachium rosenbergii]|uniref:uncharacterized protein n=1 Tax=Macrobrachium rosenbergii TaxID=79674 RepID=UPI0034D6C271